MRYLVSSNGSVIDKLVDTADSTARAGLDADVAVLSPAGTPRVADDVVLNTVLDTIAYGNDGVVDIDWAFIIDSDDATIIVHKRVVSSGDGNVEGAPRVEPDQVCRGSSDYLAVGSHTGDAIALIVLAKRHFTHIWVGGLSHQLVCLQIVVGIEVPATVATIVVISDGAVNDLLW